MITTEYKHSESIIMRHIHIRDKLSELNINLEDLALGDFDYIGEFTAKKQREASHPYFKTHGCFFRPNYERGILIYSLIRKYNLTSMLEIGFGRGYGTMCAAKAFHDMGIEGKIVTIDPNLDEDFVRNLTSVSQIMVFNDSVRKRNIKQCSASSKRKFRHDIH